MISGSSEMLEMGKDETFARVFSSTFALKCSRSKSCALGSYHGSAIQLPFLRVEPPDYSVGRNGK